MMKTAIFTKHIKCAYITTNFIHICFHIELILNMENCQKLYFETNLNIKHELERID